MSDLMTRVAAAVLEDPSLRELVMPALRQAMEHASPAARGQYLKDHPNADPKNHTLRGDPKPKGEKKEEAAPAKEAPPKDKGKGDKAPASSAGTTKKVKELFDKVKVPGLAAEIGKLPKEFLDKNEGYSHPAVKALQKHVLDNLTPEEVKAAKDAVEVAYHGMFDVWKADGFSGPPNKWPQDIQDQHAQMMSTWRAIRDIDPSKAKGGGAAGSKDDAPAKPKSTGTKAKQTPALKKLLSEHSLESGDADALLKWKKAKPQGTKITDAERLRRFLAHAKPETRERMKGMSPADFMKIYNALMDEEGEGGEGGKQASAKTASGPDPRGRNWLEKWSPGIHRWVWTDRGGDGPSFTVTEHEWPGGSFYKLQILLPDGSMFKTNGQKNDKEHWFIRAADLYKKWDSLAGFDLSKTPERWSRMGKAASLVRRTAAAAMADPALRDLLVPLLRG